MAHKTVGSEKFTSGPPKARLGEHITVSVVNQPLGVQARSHVVFYFRGCESQLYVFTFSGVLRRAGAVHARAFAVPARWNASGITAAVLGNRTGRGVRIFCHTRWPGGSPREAAYHRQQTTDLFKRRTNSCAFTRTARACACVRSTSIYPPTWRISARARRQGTHQAPGRLRCSFSLSLCAPTAPLWMPCCAATYRSVSPRAAGAARCLGYMHVRPPTTAY